LCLFILRCFIVYFINLFKMANEQEKNIKFVEKLLENPACLYDITYIVIHGKISKKKCGITFQK